MAKIVYPEKADFLPSKKHYLLRAGFLGVETNIDKTMLNLTNEIYLEAISLVVPEIIHQTLPVDATDDIQIPEKFHGINEITFFVSTIGKNIEKRIEEYNNSRETTRATLLDAWGSESIEELNNNFDRQLRKKYSKGTIRFSPGYSEIPLTENKKIIDFLQYNTVQAHPVSGMLSPQKSTVCMIGWY